MGKVGGPEAVQAILDKHYKNICKNVSIVEYIPAGGCTYKNRASGNDHMRLLRALWNDAVPYSSEIRRVMNLPGSDRLYTYVPQIPAGTEVLVVGMVVVVGGMGSLSGAFVASLLIGIIQTFAVGVDSSLMSVASTLGLQITPQTFGFALWKLKISQIAPILPYLFLVLILIFRPKGLLGTREG